MKPGTETKLKFKQLKRKLRLPHWQIVGVLETLWRVTEANAPAGDIGKLSDEEIAAALEWDGNASELIGSLVECKWLDRDDEFRLIVHDWSVHCPNHMKGAFELHKKPFADQIARQRAKHGARQDGKEPASNGACNPATSPILPLPNQSLPNQSEVCVTAGKPPMTPAADPAQVLFPEYPCVAGRRSGATTWLLTEAQITEWESTFPAVDVPAECRRAHGWVKANIERRKTANGMLDFLFRWLSGEQNGGRRRSNNGPQQRPRAIRSLGDE